MALVKITSKISCAPAILKVSASLGAGCGVMSVNRRGKRGTRAGHMIPESRNRRVVRNAGLKNITKQYDDRPSGDRISKEQWVITVVGRIVGTKAGDGFVTADDIASDIILMLLDAGGFNWEMEEIEDFCRRKASYAVLRYLGRKERNECEFVSADGEKIPIWELAGSVDAMQELVFDAHEAVALLPSLPTKHRMALEILCDGGNPIDVADELSVTPWDAVKLIREARDYIDRVGPLDEAA